jgi:farnesyl-diphosphate farnesyltransferase
MIQSTQNLQTVCETFKTYIRIIRKKNVPQDPNFFKISLACAKTEQFIETLFPSVNVAEIVAKGQAQQKLVGSVATTPSTRIETQDESFWIFAAVMGVCVGVAIFMVSDPVKVKVHH